jgi:hypothetical protein
MAASGRRSGREAATVARRGEVCALLPGLEDALAAGTVSAGHADAVARAAQSLPEEGRAKLVELEATVVDAAARSSVEDFARQIGKLTDSLAGDDGLSRHERRRRARYLRRWVDEHGMCHPPGPRPRSRRTSRPSATRRGGGRAGRRRTR